MATLQTRSLRLFLTLLLGVLPSAACQQRAEQQTPAPAAFFIPDGASNIQHRERQGIHEVSYQVETAYPASPFLCELTSYLSGQQWRGLREDALNPGSDSSLVRGWSDYGNATRQPETHVHAWMAQWRNEDGHLLTYALQYEYPETSAPELSTLKVAALIWPANLVRAQLGSRADQLPALMMPATTVVLAKAGESPNDRPCVQPQWSQFVNSKSERAAPVLALPFELAQVRSIDIQSDIDALEVDVEADYDRRGELGVADDVPPGYTQVRCIVTVASRAPEDDVRRVIDTADKYSSYRDVFARAHDVRRELTITTPV